MQPYYHIVIWAEGFSLKISASNYQNYLIAALFKDCNCDYTMTSKSFYKNWEKYSKSNVVFFNTQSNSLLSYLIAIIKEVQYLRKLKKQYSKVILLASYTNFLIYLFYSIVCRFLRVKIALNIMEWHIAQYENYSLFRKVNNFLFDNLTFKISNGAIVISSFIAERLRRQSKNNKILKIPVLTDIERIDSIIETSKISFKYFAYCASIGYINTINIVIEAFLIFLRQSSDKEYGLLMVISGESKKIKELENKINKMQFGEKILFYSELEYNELIQLYKNAEILLLPLRNTEQDKARYPHKIGDYTICGKPIVSNKIGEIGAEFEHKKNIIFSDSYEANSLAKSMVTLINDVDLKNSIGINARLKGEMLFNRRNYVKATIEFINSI